MKNTDTRGEYSPVIHNDAITMAGAYYGKPEAKPTLVPLHDRVIVRKDPAPEKSKGGIILVDAKEAPVAYGYVIAAGSGRFSEGVWVPTSVVAGDRVCWLTYAGTQIKSPSGEDLLVLLESEIIAKVQ